MGGIGELSARGTNHHNYYINNHIHYYNTNNYNHHYYYTVNNYHYPRAGAEMVVTGTSWRGTETRDTYSLSGFSAAHKAISTACRVK